MACCTFWKLSRGKKTRENHFDSVFKSHLMAPRCMMPRRVSPNDCFTDPKWTRITYITDIHIHARVCNASTLPTSTSHQHFIQKRCQFSPHFERQSIPKAKVCVCVCVLMHRIWSCHSVAVQHNANKSKRAASHFSALIGLSFAILSTRMNFSRFWRQERKKRRVLLQIRICARIELGWSRSG